MQLYMLSYVCGWTLCHSENRHLHSEPLELSSPLWLSIGHSLDAKHWALHYASLSFNTHVCVCSSSIKYVFFYLFSNNEQQNYFWLSYLSFGYENISSFRLYANQLYNILHHVWVWEVMSEVMFADGFRPVNMAPRVQINYSSGAGVGEAL